MARAEMLVEGQAHGMIPSIIFRNDDDDYFPGPKVWQTNNGAINGTGFSAARFSLCGNSTS